MSKIFTITTGLENLGAFRTGGQGSVYKGRRVGEIITAVKLLPTPIHSETQDNKTYSDFKNEVEKLKKVNEIPNPNIVKILSSGLSDSGSFPFIEMEYIDGPDLEDLLKPPHDPIFTIKEVIKVAEHLANALSHCHSVNVKHGDIKSNNVKYNAYSGNYVLLDFGLAIMSDEQRRTSMRQAGAIEFMAPEQYEGVMLVESDIYSYGVVLFELLCGQVPFPLTDNGETARNNVRLSHLETPVPDVMSLRRKNLPESWSEEKKEREMLVPDWLNEIINKCLEKKPENRFNNGMALKQAVIECSIAGADISGTGLQAVQRYKEMLMAREKELEHLKAGYKGNGERGRKGILITVPVFFTSLIVLFSLLGFAGYSILKSGPSLSAASNIEQPAATNTFVKASVSHPKLKGILMENIVLNIDSIKRLEIKKNQEALEEKIRVREASERTSSNEESKRPKKKKKKFLIF